MIAGQNNQLHLTYCQNVHPGETWAENFSAIRENVLPLRDELSSGQPFGIGLRLSDQASRELIDPQALAIFREFLERENLYIFTVNAFPFGNFHQSPVKQSVYLPDWSDPNRAAYTARVANILTQIMPSDVTGTISTLPLGYKTPANCSPVFLSQAAENITRVANHLDKIFKQTGREIVLAIEPEPDCLIETTAELLEFFKSFLPVDEVIRKHVGVCFDTSHQSVEFENLAASVKQIQQAKIRIAKVQLSSALEFTGSAENIEIAREFAESTYLHQTKIRKADGSLKSYDDLDFALHYEAEVADEADRWRVHYHTPLGQPDCRGLRTTRKLLAGEFAELLKQGACEHLEIETYTWGLLADEAEIRQGISSEYRWVLDELL